MMRDMAVLEMQNGKVILTVTWVEVFVLMTKHGDALEGCSLFSWSAVLFFR